MPVRSSTTHTARAHIASALRTPQRPPHPTLYEAAGCQAQGGPLFLNKVSLSLSLARARALSLVHACLLLILFCVHDAGLLHGTQRREHKIFNF